MRFTPGGAMFVDRFDGLNAAIGGGKVAELSAPSNID